MVSRLAQWEARLCEAGHRPKRLASRDGEVSIVEGVIGRTKGLGSDCEACGHQWRFKSFPSESLLIEVNQCPGTKDTKKRPLIDFDKPIFFVANDEPAQVYSAYSPVTEWAEVGIRYGRGHFKDISSNDGFDRSKLRYLKDDGLSIDRKGHDLWQIEVDQYGHAINDPSVPVIRN
jgi:hypothetical protein